MADPSTELAPSELIQRPASTAVMTPEQFDSTWRMSKALAASGSFKDIGREDGSKALARVLLGADLGMSPTQALMGIDIVKGNPQIRGVALGRMVRNSARKPLPTGESYDYAVLDRGFLPGEEFAVVALYRRDEDGSWPRVEGDPVVFPTSVGPVTIATGQKMPEAVEAFQVTQAEKRKLVKLDGAWDQQPEVMVVWRALSQLVRFYAPDVIGGVGVYTEADSHPRDVEIGGGSGEGPGWGDMPAEAVREVMNVIERAQRVGHAGLSDVHTIQQRLNGQPAEVVAQWISDSGTVLDEMAERDAPEDAVITIGSCGSATITINGLVFKFVGILAQEYGPQVATALADGPSEMERVALVLMDVAAGLEDEGDDDVAEFYRAVAEALHAEAATR